MNMMIEREPERTEEQIAAEVKVRELTAGSDPIPSHVEVQHLVAPISDLAEDIASFREERRLLEQLELPWPAALLSRGYVPLDLGVYGANFQRIREPTARELKAGISQDRAVSRASDAGLHIEARPIGEVSRSFTEIVGDIIFRRLTGPAGVVSGPPTEEFTVTTDSNRMEVIYSTGYFVSTQRGFGFSTPAKRRLPWGVYTFGAVIGGAPRLRDTLWTIPDDTTVHLDW